MDARLILDPPASGPRNMAVDEALLESAAGSGLMTLRIYTWSPATLSLGYFQAAADRALHPASADCPLVRRASGGGAILHDRELTYSLTMPCDDRFGSRAAEVYQRVHESLVETLGTWDIRAATVREQVAREPEASALGDLAQEPEPFLCFARRSSEDIVVSQAKIVGSAQRRHHRALLQHGSVILSRSSFAPELPGLRDVAEAVLPDEFNSRWLPKMEQQFQTKFVPGKLSPEEESAAQRWEQDRFGTDEWTYKR